MWGETVNLLSALAETSRLIGKVPPEVRQLVVNVLRDIVNGDPSNEVALRAKRAAIAVAAKQSYRRHDL